MNTTGAALEFSEKQLGGLLNEFNSNPSVSATTTQPVLANGDRVALIIINTGTVDVFVSFTPDVSPTNGIDIAPGGGVFALDVVEDYTLPSRGWFARTSAVASTLHIIELVRYRYSKLG